MYALADDFYFLAHDDATGRPRLPGRALGHGLAAALLAELLDQWLLVIRGGELRIIERSALLDPLLRHVLAHLSTHRGHVRLRVWLEFFHQQTPGWVSERLRRAERVHRRSRRRPLTPRKSVRHPSADPNPPASPAARLAMQLRYQRLLDPSDVFLLGLALATGLDEHLFHGMPQETRDWAYVLPIALEPARQELITAVAEAVGETAPAYRL